MDSSSFTKPQLLEEKVQRTGKTSRRFGPETVACVAGILIHLMQFYLRAGHLQDRGCEFDWETVTDKCNTSWINISFASAVLFALSACQTQIMLTHYKLCRLGGARSASGCNSTLLVWYPKATELALFCIHSPAHALLWMTATKDNWFSIAIVMISLWVELRVLTGWYQTIITNRKLLIPLNV